MKFSQVATLLPLLSLAVAAPYGYEADKGKDRHEVDAGYEAGRGKEGGDYHRADGKKWEEGKKEGGDYHHDDGKKGDDRHYGDDGKKGDDYHRDDGKKYDDKKEDDKKHKDHLKFPFEFTSTAVAWAGPDQIVNNSQVAVPGLDGGYGTFAFGINSVQDVICYNITVYITGDYQSPAATATHIHEAARGAAGPPRLSFPDPTPLDNSTIDEWGWRASFGCLRGPFETGLDGDNGEDTATGFTLSQIEDNVEGFFADTHTVEFPAGAIRGQLEWKKY